MKPINSLTTMSPKEPLQKVGMLLGELGVETPETGKIAAWLAARNPVAVNLALQSRASQHGVELTLKTEGRYPTGPNGEKRESYTVTTGCLATGGTTESREAALADCVKFMTPAPQREIEGWLAELSAIVARRFGSEFDETLKLEAYASRLKQFPADIVRDTLLKRTWQFWPTWAELEPILSAKSNSRRVMLTAIATEPEPEAPQIEGPTDEQREQMAQWAREYVQDKRDALQWERKPHWTETAPPDDPRWKSLHEARQRNDLMRKKGTDDASR